MIKKINHIAIAVRSISEAAQFYEEKLGLKLTDIEEVPERGVRVGFIPIGEVRIELVEPLSLDSTIQKFLEERGPGLHHICFEVDALASELTRLSTAGVKLIDQSPRTGAHGTKVGFIHPRASGGVLIELSQLPEQ